MELTSRYGRGGPVLFSSCYTMTKMIANETCTQACRPPGSFSPRWRWRRLDLADGGAVGRYNYRPINKTNR